MPSSRMRRSTVQRATAMTLSVQVPPDLPGAVDAVVGVERLRDQRLQFGVADGAGRGRGLAFVVGVVGGGGDLAVVLGEDPADRLDAAEAVLVLVDERYERVCGRSSSAAKKDAAALRMSLARFSSAFSFFSRFSSADSSLVVPGRAPASIWSCRTHLRSVSVVPMPSFGGDRLHRGPLGVVLRPHLGDHADRTIAQLKRVLGRTCHDSILSNDRVPTEPGTVQGSRSSWPYWRRRCTGNSTTAPGVCARRTDTSSGRTRSTPPNSPTESTPATGSRHGASHPRSSPCTRRWFSSQATALGPSPEVPDGSRAMTQCALLTVDAMEHKAPHTACGLFSVHAMTGRLLFRATSKQDTICY